MRRRIVIIALVLLSVFQHRPSNAANIDISLRFSTIETEHFSIHFHQGIEELAQKAATIAEGAHDNLVNEFNWTSREKTQLVLIDDTDFTNGFATVLPYNTIYVKIVPPSLDMTIGEYEDWLRMLIVHEYSHILTMDTARGYSEVTRSIFGKPLPGLNPFSFLMFIASAPPNIFMPSWWHEGMATWGETEYAGIGRGTSTFYEMIIRMAVAENNIPSVAQIIGEVAYWPDGHMPYIFGLRLQKYIADRYGKEALGRLNTAHAGRFPYFINGATLGLFGKDYPTLYADMIRDLKNEERKRIDALMQAPLTPFKRFNIDGEILTNPRYSPDGSLIAFNRRDPHGHEAIMIAGRDGMGVREVVRRLPSDHTICWSPDGRRLYFSQAEVNRGFNIYQDLYAYDLKDRSLKRLTSGLRVKEPDISPDGVFAVITNDKGSQNIALLEPEGDGYRLNQLTDYKHLHLSNPRWSPDGRYIAYSVKDNSGRSGIHLYNVPEKADTLLFEDGRNNAYPAWSPDGRHIVYTSDETGVFNIFAYSIEEGKRYQVTHLLGGAFQPDVSPDGKDMVFSSYDSKGFKIAGIEYDPERWMETLSPSIKPYWDGNPPVSSFSKEGTSEIPPFIKGGEGGFSGSKPYSPLPTLLPRFWLPTLSGDHEGTVVGAFTAGQDVLKYNTYLSQIDYGTSSGKWYYDMMYLNDYAYPTFAMQAYARPVLYSGLVPEGDYFELDKSLILSMTVPLNYLESRSRFTIGYQFQRQEELGENTIHTVTLFEGRKDNIFAGVEFFNTLKYPYSISYEEGRRINLLYKRYSKEAGSDLDSQELIASYAEHLLMPSDYLRHHVLYLSLTGAVAASDRTVQQAFQLGGYPQQSPYPLRGYPSRFATGQYIATGTLEYRMPVRYLFKGPGTQPFFYEKLHGAVFADAGEVWDEREGFSGDELKTSGGIEARLDMTLGYMIKITPTIGIARGFNEGGETIAYFTIYANL